MKIYPIIIAAFVLSSCQQNQPDDRICTTPPPTAPGAWSDCIHKWAYRLAGAEGSNTEIARAAVSACSDAIAFQVNEAKPDERMQLLADINRSAPETAIFRVVQARAGNCSIPE